MGPSEERFPEKVFLLAYNVIHPDIARSFANGPLYTGPPPPSSSSPQTTSPSNSLRSIRATIAPPSIVSDPAYALPCSAYFTSMTNGGRPGTHAPTSSSTSASSERVDRSSNFARVNRCKAEPKPRAAKAGTEPGNAAAILVYSGVPQGGLHLDVCTIRIRQGRHCALCPAAQAFRWHSFEQ